jgi:hypothetical protein
MVDYRIFLLGLDGHIVGVDVVRCESDLEAMAAASAAGRPDRGVEIWQNARMVGRLHAAEKADFPNG